MARREKKVATKMGALKSQNGGRKLIERAWKSIGDYSRFFSLLNAFHFYLVSTMPLEDVFIFIHPTLPHLPFLKVSLSLLGLVWVDLAS